MSEEIKLTAIVKDKTVEIFADKFPEDAKDKFGLTAKPVSFERRALFGQITGDQSEPVLVVSTEEARRFAKEILRDTEGD